MKAEQEPLKSVVLRYEMINKILGPTKTNDYISTELINSYLNRLNFKFSYQDLSWKVQIPHLRSDDITREIDLI